MKATGTLNAVAEYVEIDIRPEDNSVLAQITGTWVGTLVPMIQAETDGPWVECRWLDTDADAPSENTDANGNFQFLRVAGAQRVRVYMSAYTSGEAVVALRGSRGMGVQEPTPPPSGGATEATLLLVESAVDGLEALLAPPSTLGPGATKTVAAAATPEQLTGSSTPCQSVYLRAPTTNTGVVGWGGSGIAGSGGNGPQLGPGDEIWIPIGNANAVYLSASVNGEGVKWSYVAW